MNGMWEIRDHWAGRQSGLQTNHICNNYEGWNFNSGNYLFTTDTK